MSGLKYATILFFTLVAGFFSFVGASRYVTHIQSTVNYVWPARPPQATIIFGGDMMFDRSIRTVIDQKGGLPAPAGGQAGDFIFSCIDDVLKNSDMVVANLEGPITEHESVSASSTPGGEFNYTFTFPTSTAPLLFKHNIRVVNLGNNHILNFGTAGARSTISELEKAGVWNFGDPLSQTVATSTVNGIQFAFINYNEFNPVEHSNILKNVGMSSTTIEQIQLVRKTGALPIVYAHWGIEYATTSSAYSRELAHSFVDAGAEIVIGSHPHVVQESEAYKGKRIYYSLGNFIFDQYFNEDVRKGLLLKVKFGHRGVLSVKEIPIELGRDRRTCVIEY